MDKQKDVPLTRTWFDNLERVLHAEAELAGLLGHGTMIGNAREFFVGRVLRSVLPTSLHIGTGVVIGRGQTKSKQIDIIVYDASFPLMETQPSQGIYFAEGVVAAIEVKSKLDRTKLTQALDNCVSVTRLPVGFPPDQAQLANISGRTVLTPPFSGFVPCAHIFAFSTSFRKITTIGGHIDDWASENSIRDAKYLPEFLVAGPFLGMSRGRWFRPGMPKEMQEELQRKWGRDIELLMAVWKVKNPFGWLLMNLIITASQRASDHHKFAMDQYLRPAIASYWNEELNGQPFSAIHSPIDASGAG